MGGAGRFWKNWKKQKTPLPELSTLVIWPRYDLQLNYSIGGNFNIHPPTFGMDGRFPFYHAPGSFSSQNFRHFDHTLAEPIIDHAGPSGILLNRSDSPASVVGESDSPTSSRLAEGLALKRKKKQYDKWPQEEQRAQVMNIKPWFGWARNGPCVRRKRILRKCRRLLRKATSGFACIHLPSSDTGWKGKHLQLLHVDNS